MAASTFRISDDLNLDGVTINLGGATTSQALTYYPASTSFLPTTETPPGTVVMYVGSSVPSGWLLCDGQQVLASGSLGTVLGTRYNTGGETAGNVRVPNFVGEIPVAMSSHPSNLITSVSSATHTFNHSHNSTFGTDGVAVSISHSHTTNTNGDHGHSIASDDKGSHSHGGTTGGGGAHTHNYSNANTSGTLGFTGYSDNSHTHQTSSNAAAHSHNAVTASAGHAHSSTTTQSISLSHSHSITSIASSSQTTSISTHSHGTLIMRLMFIIKS